MLSLFLALLMVFMLFPVSALADGDAAGDPSAEEVTQIAEGAQSDPEENSGETPEEKAEENSEDETAEAGLIAFLGADSRDETLAYHYRVETAAGETVTLAPQPDFTDESALSYVWARFDAEQDTYVELPEETGAVLTLTAAAEEIGVEKLYACTVTAPDAAGTAVFTLVEKAPAAENEPESEEQTAEEDTPVMLASTSYDANAALSYAQRHWNDGKGLCVEFVVDCVRAGGLNVPQSIIDTGAFLRWFEANGYSRVSLVGKTMGNYDSFWEKDNANLVSPGDVLFYVPVGAQKTDNNPYHAVIACGYGQKRTDNRLLAYGHNPAWNQVAVDNYINPNNAATEVICFRLSAATSTTKPDKTKDMSVDDYMTYYAQSVTSFSGTGKPKSGTLKLYRLPETLNNTVSYTTTTGSVRLVRKIVNSAGNTWYETSTGAFAYSGDITIVASPTINDLNLAISNKGTKPYISANIGYSSENKPQSWSLAYGTTTALGTAHTETFTDSVLSAYNPVPISVQFGTEEPELRYGTKYYYRLSVTAQRGEVVSVDGSFTTDKCTSHTWDSGTVTTQPICCTDGVKTFKCTNPGCGETKTEVIPRTRDHKWDSGAVTKQPTCVATGIKTYTCTTPGCGATTTETVAATGKHTWDSGAVTTPAKPGEAGVKTYTCTVCSQTKTESIPALPLTYTVSYDANGGSGAPAAQTKTQDVALTLSGTRPTRDGYTFLGWATSKTASSAQYQPGGTYTANAAATFYAVWEKKAPSIEEQLRAAIANGESQFDTPGDCTLSADLVVPNGFNLYVDQGTLTIPNGVTLTVESEGFLGSRSDTVVQSGGKIVNNGTLNSFMGGSITVDNGGTLENNGGFIVFGGGSFHNRGTYTPGEYGALNFEITESDYKTDLTGVDLMLVSLECWSGKEEDIRKLFAEAGNVQYVSAQISDISEATELTLSADLTIPKNGGIFMSDDAVLTVPAGKTLTNKGSICLYDNARLIIEAGAEFVNEGWVYADQTSKVSVAGRFTVAENGDSQIGVKNWECTGELNTDSGYFSLFADAANSAELEEALKSGANTVNVTGDITLDRSITVPENTAMFIYSDVTLTVPASKTLTNLGSIHVRGTLNVEGKFTGNRVDVFSEGTLTPDSIPHGSEGVLIKSIEITGADTILPGGEAEYTARITPDDAWISWAYWTIVSGDELASISYDGVLTAGDTPGTVTIRAEALDDSGVCAEKTVTIQKAEPEYETKLAVSTATASQGKEVTLDVAIEGNPGLGAISFQIEYDKTRIQLIGYEDAGLTDWSVSVGTKDGAVWIDENGYKANGSILRLKFRVLDEAEDGLAYVTLSDITAADVDETIYGVSVIAGGVTVTSRIPGDINGDGIVNVLDCLRLKKYLAGFNVTIVEENADVTGDGNINVVDCLRLKKYLAGFDVEIK